MEGRTGHQIEHVGVAYRGGETHGAVLISVRCELFEHQSDVRQCELHAHIGRANRGGRRHKTETTVVLRSGLRGGARDKQCVIKVNVSDGPLAAGEQAPLDGEVNHHQLELDGLEACGERIALVLNTQWDRELRVNTQQFASKLLRRSRLQVVVDEDGCCEEDAFATRGRRG